MMENKQMHKLITISCYFGKLPEHFPEFLRSLERNPSIDFLLVTDCCVSNPPKNVKVYSCTFEEVKKRMQMVADFPIVLDRPYKLCDYRPAWGIAFHDLIEGYDFWGHCDMDMIFGDIRSFLPESVLEQKDKIYKFGHLTYYRNSEENNNRYKLDGGVSYMEVFTTPKACAFDEIAGSQNIYDKHGFPCYFSRDYADITYGKVRFTLSYFHVPQELIAENNYDKQLFYWEDGRVFRAFVKEGCIHRDEFNYIHFSKRKMTRNDLPENCDAFFITNRGLFEKTGEVQMEDFNKYNPHEPIPELKRKMECWWNGKKGMAEYYLDIVQRKVKIIIRRGT